MSDVRLCISVWFQSLNSPLTSLRTDDLGTVLFVRFTCTSLKPLFLFVLVNPYLVCSETVIFTIVSFGYLHIRSPVNGADQS